jgi:hypothetical protein
MATIGVEELVGRERELDWIDAVLELTSTKPANGPKAGKASA